MEKGTALAVPAIRAAYTKLLPALQTCREVEDQVELLQREITPLIVEAEEQEQPADVLSFRKSLVAASGVNIHYENKLRQLLPETFVSMRSPSEFYEWVCTEGRKNIGNSTLSGQMRIQKIKREYPEIHELHVHITELQEQLEADETYKKITALQKKIHGQEKAIQYMKSALDGGKNMTEQKRENTEVKLTENEESLPVLKEQLQQLIDSCELAKEYDQVKEKLQNIAEETGLGDAREDLKQSNKEAGSSSKISGSTFEDMSYNAVLHLIAPKYCTEEELQILNAGQIAQSKAPTVCHILHSATLGMHGAEIDYIMVRGTRTSESKLPENTLEEYLNNLILKKDRGRKVEKGNCISESFIVDKVLAVIECKANARDILHNVPRMQTMLSWLTGDNAKKESYDKDAFFHETWNTSYFTNGFFNKPTGMVCTRTNTQWIFPSADCFSEFSRESDGFFKKNLYYISKKGKIGLPAGTSRKILLHCIFKDILLDELESKAEEIEEVRQWALESFEDFDRNYRAATKLKDDVFSIRVVPFHTFGDEEYEEDSDNDV